MKSSAFALSLTFVCCLGYFHGRAQADPEPPGREMLYYNMAMSFLAMPGIPDAVPSLDVITLEYLVREQRNLFSAYRGSGTVAYECCPNTECKRICPCEHFKFASADLGYTTFVVPVGMRMTFKGSPAFGAPVITWKRTIDGESFRLYALKYQGLPQEVKFSMTIKVSGKLRSQIGGNSQYEFSAVYREGQLQFMPEI